MRVTLLVRKYEDSDILQIDDWCKARNLPMINPSLLPDTGYVVDGIAAGFLYLTNSKVGLLDSYISNPESAGSDRNIALDQITEKLLEIARINKLKLVICSTDYNTIKTRAKSFGFRSCGMHESFTLEL